MTFLMGAAFGAGVVALIAIFLYIVLRSDGINKGGKT